ncbi:MAG: N-formylglutamate amidohydrolase [Planctomycetes bacterium]|nr:N-formylglutamate amidohydrolase [Planctomycetota bacterium]
MPCRTKFLGRAIVLFVTLALVSFAPATVAWAKEPATLDARNIVGTLVIVEEGTLPIVITAPHGGRDEVPGVPERQGRGVDQFVTQADSNTFELAHNLARNLERRLKAKPYFVGAKFARKYIDVNRPTEQGVESPNAMPVYRAYHEAIAHTCRTVQNKHHVGLLIDVHGQAGYPDNVLVGTVEGKTMTLLVNRHGREALAGQNGLLGWLADSEVKTLPALGSGSLKAPKFNGGYTVQTYGSDQPGGIDAVQFETGANFRSTKEQRIDAANKFGAAIERYYQAFLAPNAAGK